MNELIGPLVVLEQALVPAFLDQQHHVFAAHFERFGQQFDVERPSADRGNSEEVAGYGPERLQHRADEVVHLGRNGAE